MHGDARRRPAMAHTDDMTRLREPIPIEPFLTWLALREREIGREIDRSNLQISASKRTGSNTAARPQRATDQLLYEIGWEPAMGERKLFRWINDEHRTHIERAVVEDALHHAGVELYDIYPDLEPPGQGRDAYCPTCRADVYATDSGCPWCENPVLDQRPIGSRPRLGQGRKMTDQQVRAAHVIYQQTGLSVRRLAELLYERHGYKSASACATSLNKAFVSLGLERRDKIEASIAAHTTHGLTAGGHAAPLYKRTLRLERHGQCEAVMKYGKPCPRAAQPGTTTCGYHAAGELARRREQIAAINAQRDRQAA